MIEKPAPQQLEVFEDKGLYEDWVPLPHDDAAEEDFDPRRARITMKINNRPAPEAPPGQEKKRSLRGR